MDETGDRVGRVIGDAVHALTAGVALLDLLGDDGERLQAAGERAERDPALVVPLDEVVLRAPVPRPGAVRDFYAFEQHARAGRRSRGQGLLDEWYQIPVFYFSNPYALIGSGQKVAVPPGCRRLDFELEVAAIVGRTANDVSPEQAAEHIAGYLVMNDWSARDLQRQEMNVGLGPAKAKDFATTLGPCLVTADELEPYRKGVAFDLDMTVRVNGRPYTCANLADVHWSFEEMLSFAARGTEVRAGDVLGTGTCATGCILELSQTHGSVRYPWLKPGDVVEATVEQLGTVRNEIVAGVAPAPLRRDVPGVPKARCRASCLVLACTVDSREFLRYVPGRQNRRRPPAPLRTRRR